MRKRVLVCVLALTRVGCGGSAEGGPHADAARAGGTGANGAGGTSIGAAAGTAGTLANAGATSGGPTTSKPKPVTFENGDGMTCSCAESNGVATLPLACLASELDGACAPTLAPITLAIDASELGPFMVTRHDGCGKTTFSFAGGYGGVSCTYDTTSAQLIGASISSDTSVPPCGTFMIAAGERDTCREGKLCSLSGNDASCVEACSLEAWGRPWGSTIAGQPLGDHALIEPCEPGTSTSYRLRSGCGQIVIEQNGWFRRFDATSKRLDGVSYPGSEDQTCAGVYGVAVEACSLETTCSLCAGAADECSQEQRLGG